MRLCQPHQLFKITFSKQKFRKNVKTEEFECESRLLNGWHLNGFEIVKSCTAKNPSAVCFSSQPLENLKFSSLKSSFMSFFISLTLPGVSFCTPILRCPGSQLCCSLICYLNKIHPWLMQIISSNISSWHLEFAKLYGQKKV